MNGMSIRVLVVDDSILYRRVLTEALKSVPEVEVVGSVANGGQVVTKVRELLPDVVTLDIEMPGMNGIEVMNALRQAGLSVNVLVVSSVTLSGGLMTLQALENGAFDFITKPQSSTREENERLLREALAPRLRALGHRLDVQKILRSHPGRNGLVETSARVVQREEVKISPPATVTKAKPELVVIGVSTGGPNALGTIVSDLPRLDVPVVIVQHMPPIFTGFWQTTYRLAA